jgi:signal transduction histidine kinase
LPPVIASNFTGSARTPLGVVINLASLGLLVWGATTEAHVGLGGRHLVALIALVVAAAAWVVWVMTGFTHPSRPTAMSLTTFGVAGGVLTAFAPLGLVFVGVAAVGATIAWDFSAAVWVVLAGPAAMAIAGPAAGASSGRLGGGFSAAVAGAAMGISRRQSLMTTRRDAETKVAEARADAEAARAELLAGRNHLARELHDVLAHTLSALSLQLEALDTLVAADGEPVAAVREQLEITKRLVRTGLDEARGAVRALREDQPPLPDQLARLAGGGMGTELEVTGPARPLGPDVTLALYRVAQEAITNVVKHAPGSHASIRLTFDDRAVSLTVTNDLPHANGSPLSTTGGGHGIQGIKERILLLGGRVETGPADGGWRVFAEVPA